MIRRLPSFVIVVGLAVFVVGCASSTSPSTTVASVRVTGVAPVRGASAQFMAVATMGDGSTQDVTSIAAWTTSSTALGVLDATVSTTGVVTGVIDGTLNVAATYQGVTGTDTIVIVG